MPIDGFIGYWPLNVNADDGSGNNRHGTIIGDLSFSTDKDGLANNAASFNDNGCISIGDLQELDFAEGNFTLSLWIKDGNNRGAMLIKDKSLGPYSGVTLAQNDNIGGYE